MALYDDLNTAIANAQKAGEADSLTTLRLLKNTIDSQVKTGAELGDDLVGRCALAEVKKRREAADLYRNGGAEDKAAAEEQEATLIEVYAPKQLSDAELESIVDAAIAETGASAVSDLGKVMPIVKAKVGQSADMGRVSGLVRSKLS